MLSTLLLTFVLGFLLSLTAADHSVGFEFSLRTPDGQKVTLDEDDFRLTLSDADADAEGTIFRLTDGVLTNIADERRVVYGPVPPIYPPVLIPLLLHDSLYPAIFEAVYEKDPSGDGDEVLRLINDHGPIGLRLEGFITHNLYVKPKYSREPLDDLFLKLVYHEQSKSKTLDSHCPNNHRVKNQQVLDDFDLK